MSKYTTEVRFICESEAGYTESKGFNSIDEILTIAAPKIFNFDFPIFDENYRLPLEKKILRHYYTREISEETVGLWKLRLQDRLCMIMPYYNKLYESELLQFNPLYDVDLTRTHTGESEGDEDTTKNTTTETDSTLDKTNSETDNVTTGRTDDSTTTINKIGKSTDSGTETTTKHNEIEKIDDATTEENIDGLSRESGQTGVHRVDNLGDHTVRETTIDNDVASLSNEYDTENKDLTLDETTNDTFTHGKTETKTLGTTVTNTSNGTKWDLHSDTPQGGLNGVISSDYLTDVHKIIDDNVTNVAGGQGSDTTTYGGQDHNVKALNGSHTEDNSYTKDITGSEVTIRTENEDIARTVADEENTTTSHGKNITTKDSKTIDYDKTTTEESNETNETNFGKVVDTSETDLTTYENQTDETQTRSANTIGRDTLDKNEQTTSTGNKHSTNTEEYIEHVAGKQGSGSYSKMLIEFRETFLNIDKMIIKDLSLLFFGLW